MFFIIIQPGYFQLYKYYLNLESGGGERYDPVNHTFKDSVAGREGKRAYNVTQVRPNDGQHLNETNRQPARPQ